MESSEDADVPRATAAHERASGGSQQAGDSNDNASSPDLEDTGKTEDSGYTKDSGATGRARGSLGARAFLGLISAMALLMLGTSIGMLLNAPSEQRADPEPSLVDIGFAQDMTVHNQQSITLASLAAQRAQDPAVRQLAREINNRQRDQTGRMQGWLSLWGEPAASPNAPLSWMTAAPDQPTAGQSLDAPEQMPGMASHADLARLRTLRAGRFDAEFLRLMLRHLDGSTAIATYGTEHGSQSAVQQLSSTMVDEQDSQRQQMRHLLAVRRVPPLPLR